MNQKYLLKERKVLSLLQLIIEEAKALCTKIGIIVKGEFKFFGKSTQNKDKYGTGYDIEIKIRSLTELEITQILINSSDIITNTLKNCISYLYRT